MSTTIRNGQISKLASQGKRKRQNEQKTDCNKKNLAVKLNKLLVEYADLKGLGNYLVAGKKLGLPKATGKTTTKQISGYISFVKGEIKKIKVTV